MKQDLKDLALILLIIGLIFFIVDKTTAQVGINTTSPEAMLDVAEDTSSVDLPTLRLSGVDPELGVPILGLGTNGVVVITDYNPPPPPVNQQFWRLIDWGLLEPFGVTNVNLSSGIPYQSYNIDLALVQEITVPPNTLAMVEGVCRCPNYKRDEIPNRQSQVYVGLKPLLDGSPSALNYAEEKESMDMNLFIDGVGGIFPMHQSITTFMIELDNLSNSNARTWEIDCRGYVEFWRFWVFSPIPLPTSHSLGNILGVGLYGYNQKNPPLELWIAMGGYTNSNSSYNEGKKTLQWKLYFFQ